MPYQSAVFPQQGFGVVGELFDDGPVRCEPFILVSSDATNNIFGRACTITSQGIVAVGGTGVFAGFLVNPKASTTSGTLAGGALAPTLTLPNNSNVEILNLGCIIVALPAAASIGDLVMYNTTTGALSTIAPSATIPAGTLFANATVDRYTVTAAGLAVIRATTVPVPPAAP